MSNRRVRLLIGNVMRSRRIKKRRAAAVSGPKLDFRNKKNSGLLAVIQ